MLTGLVSQGAVLACSGERYARPIGPAPTYEAAPVMPWDAGAAPAAESALPDLRRKLGQSRVTEARLWARSTIQLVATRETREVVIQPRAQSARDERRQIENVTND
jgi:hypothetical protein